MQQAFEQLEVEKLAGKTVTFSVYLRANATYNGTFSVQILTSTTGNTQTPTWTAQATTNHVPSTSAYTKVSVTATIPTTAKGLAFYVGQNTGLATGSIYYIALAKAEIGTLATEFVRLGNCLQADLAACQRYFYSIGTASGIESICNGTYYSSTAFYGVISYPVPMRTAAPSVTPGTAGSFTVLSNGASRAVTSVSTQWYGQNAYTINFNTSAATAGDGGWVQNSATSGYLQFSAEL